MCLGEEGESFVCSWIALSHGALGTGLCARSPGDSEDCHLVEVAGASVGVLVVDGNHGDCGGGGEATGH